MESLWPSDIKGKTIVKAPVTILREQAELLAEKTQGEVTADVPMIKPHWSEGKHFKYAFDLHSTPLSYSYTLFLISHDVSLYPVNLIITDDDIKSELGMDAETENLSATDEDDFKDHLRKIFATEKTGRIVSAILAQR